MGAIRLVAGESVRGEITVTSARVVAMEMERDFRIVTDQIWVEVDDLQVWGLS
jgi:hypothetical protein